MHLLFVGDTAVEKSHIVHTLAECGKIYEPKVTIGINYKVCNISNKNITFGISLVLMIIQSINVVCKENIPI